MTMTRSKLRAALPYALILLVLLLLPLSGNEYRALIGTRAAIYWVLIAGLNLVVGYAGQLAIGYVALFALGAYTASILAAGTVLPEVSPALALLAASGVGAVFGLVVGLPALRLRTFYFAMTTLGFATIVTQVALGWQDVTGGGIGLSGPSLPAPFDTAWGLYGLCVGLAIIATIITANAARSRFGRALIATRDAEVAAEASGISKPALLVSVFLFAGAAAGLAGGLFASLQTYITPDAFTFDLSLLFFISILIGGRGSILGPLLGTIILTLLPEIAAPLAAWSTFVYAGLLLVIVLAMPGGIAALLDRESRKALPVGRVILPQHDALRALLGEQRNSQHLSLSGIVLRFGGLRAIDGLDLSVAPGEVHGLIGPNGSGTTTTLNVISGYYKPQEGTLSFGDAPLPAGLPVGRAARGICRTFQTPRIIGEETVLENVMVGGTLAGRATFVEALLSLPRARADERLIRARALLALKAVGLDGLGDIRADRLQHSELRFLEIARGLMLHPRLVLLDEPAAGLSTTEIERLGALIRAISREGVAVLLVEHHADLIFEVCDRVTVLNLGRKLADGTPAEIRVHKEVVSAYLGA